MFILKACLLDWANTITRYAGKILGLTCFSFHEKSEEHCKEVKQEDKYECCSGMMLKSLQLARYYSAASLLETQIMTLFVCVWCIFFFFFFALFTC